MMPLKCHDLLNQPRVYMIDAGPCAFLLCLGGTSSTCCAADAAVSISLARGVYAVLPELDQEGWTSDDFVRDMPVDYTLLLENLLDPGPVLLPPVIVTSIDHM